jgi:hypothetical protein
MATARRWAAGECFQRDTHYTLSVAHIHMIIVVGHVYACVCVNMWVVDGELSHEDSHGDREPLGRG